MLLLHEGEHFTTPIKPAAKNNKTDACGRKPLIRPSGSIARPELIAASYRYDRYVDITIDFGGDGDDASKDVAKMVEGELRVRK